MSSEKGQPSALSASRCYADRVKSFTPIAPLTLCEISGVSIEVVMEFFDEHFGGYAEYVRQCEQGEPLGRTLARLFGDESA